MEGANVWMINVPRGTPQLESPMKEMRPRPNQLTIEAVSKGLCCQSAAALRATDSLAVSAR